MRSDELRYMIDQHLGKPKRYHFSEAGMEESFSGAWVGYREYKDEIASLHEQINKLKAVAAKDYHKGYNDGKSAGPDYNMRNN